jgi:hypothetical protein
VYPVSNNEQENGAVVFFDRTAFFKAYGNRRRPARYDYVHARRQVHLLTADEGQPNDAYTIDPEGSVTMIDLISGAGIAALTQADVTTVRFHPIQQPGRRPQSRRRAPACLPPAP